jgi:hypothetical protein
MTNETLRDKIAKVCFAHMDGPATDEMDQTCADAILAKLQNRIEELEAQLAAMTAERDRLEQRYQREVLGLNNEGDPIGGPPPIGLKARAEAAEAKLARVIEIANLIAGRMMK